MENNSKQAIDDTETKEVEKNKTNESAVEGKKKKTKAIQKKKTGDEVISKEKKERTSRTKRAGLIISVGRTDSAMRKGHYADRISDPAPVFLAGVTQAALELLLDKAVEITKKNGLSRVKPESIQAAIRSKEMLQELTGNAAILDGKTHRGMLKKMDSKKESGDDGSKSDEIPKKKRGPTKRAKTVDESAVQKKRQKGKSKESDKASE